MIATGESHDHDRRDDGDAADDLPEPADTSKGERRVGGADRDPRDAAPDAPDTSPGRRRRRRHEHTRLLRGWRRRVGRR